MDLFELVGRPRTQPFLLGALMQMIFALVFGHRGADANSLSGRTPVAHTALGDLSRAPRWVEHPTRTDKTTVITSLVHNGEDWTREKMENVMGNLNRRHFLAGLAAATLTPKVVRSFEDIPIDFSAGAVFQHGVASGDPLERRVILWTRITPTVPLPYVRVHCVIYADASMRRPIRRLRLITGPWRDYTVKVDVSNLRPGGTYYYRFEALGQESSIGRTRTLSTGQPDHLRFAVASCSNYSDGFFSAYRHISNREDLDFVLHLGDYLYEYGDETSGSRELTGRVHSPNAELIALDQYRERHSQYKMDMDLQEAHRQHPFITVWDDHETANNAWSMGAANHQPGDGDYAIRKSAAMQAYFEWMPIRVEGARFAHDENIFRSFRFGDLARIDMLDSRLFGRDQQTPMLIDPFTGDLLVDPSEVPAILEELESSTRQMLGQVQEDWLHRRLEASTRRKVQWHLLGQQTMLAQIQTLLPGTDLRIPINTDQWDGYPDARARLLRAVANTGRDNLIILTGDMHSSWANEVAETPYDGATYDPSTSQGSRAVEFITPGITSRAVDSAVAPLIEERVLAANPHTKYVEFRHQGYALMDIDRRRARCEWFHLDDVANPHSSEHFAMAAETSTGSRRTEILMDAPVAPRRDAPARAPSEAPARSFFM